MTPERFQQIKELFERVVELSADHRKAVLDRECASDPELRLEVERLLVDDSTGTRDHTRTSPVPGLATGVLAGDDRTGDVIGPYKLVRPLGEGGMGTVWLAEQSEPVKRRVALKLIKLGMDTKQVVARFESERQALALMSHPYIARVYDAGATDSGRPYFVMEHVAGKPITEYCDAHGLSTNARLELFGQVCDALQHAHQKGVIHRDIKPSNVLVEELDGKPVPKVIDFGVAKATEQRLTERTFFTELGHMVGTPAYMSPEQADPTTVDIDTRTDVYSLGVLLYELLVGVLPFDPKELRERGYEEILRVIREEDPPAPSTRAGSLPDLTRSGTVDRGRLQRELRGDLDWIVLKALSKERERRYASASELASELNRYLTDEPVTARPPSPVYQLRKFARRNKVLVGGVAATLVMLAAGATVSTILGFREARARSDLEVVVDFQSDMLARIDPEQVGLRLFADLRHRLEEAERRRSADGEVREAELSGFSRQLGRINPTDVARSMLEANILAPAADTIDSELDDQPLSAARLRSSLGKTYLALGLYDGATEQARQAFTLRSRELGSDHSETLFAAHDLALALFKDHDYEEAESLFRDTLARRTSVLGAEHPETLRSRHDLGGVLLSMNRLEEAESELESVLEAQRRVLGADDEATLGTTHDLGMLYKSMGRVLEAEAILDDALAGMRRSLGVEHPFTQNAMINVAALLRSRGELERAESLVTEALDVRRRLYGESHALTLNAAANLAAVLSKAGKADRAIAIQRGVLEGRREAYGEGHPQIAKSMQSLAISYFFTERYEEAETLYRDAIEIRMNALGPEHPQTLATQHNLAMTVERLGRRNEAEQLLREVTAIRSRVLGPEHDATLAGSRALVNLLYRQRRLDEAIELCAQVLDASQRVLGSEHGSTVTAALMQARNLNAAGRPAQAVRLLQDVLDSLPTDHARRAKVVERLGAYREAAGG